MFRNKLTQSASQRETSRLSYEKLESRRLLSADPLTLNFDPEIYSPDTSEEIALVDKVGVGLAWLHEDYTEWLSAGGGSSGSPFTSASSAMSHYDSYVQSDSVLVEVYTNLGASSPTQALSQIGFVETAAYGTAREGLIPLESIDELVAINDVNFARIPQGHMTNVGITDSQGDMAQESDELRNIYNVDGTGVTVGVISDSYDISNSALGSAATDISTGDLPAGISVLDDSYLPDLAIDEGRAMLQIVHDVAPGANLAFHTAGVSEVAYASAITDLHNVGADVIVDDIIILSEPMFQDGIVAQAANSVVANGTSYFSAAGNQARRSYESTFNPGPLINIDGNLETAHEFNTGTGDFFQSVTIPTGGLFRVSFQWDSPFASAGGIGSNNDLNIYLVSGGNTIVSLQGAENNIGGDAYEIPVFRNNTANTQFDILITSAAGALPGLIKYVDFGVATTYNEYLTNSPTMFGHANAKDAVAVGAAAFFSTPEFGVNPPVVESFSALAGTDILFDTAGNALPVPEQREIDFVAPDDTNNTFFGADSPADADAFPNFRGTSAAAPHVAAIAALMLEADPTLSAGQIRQALIDTSIDMDNPYTVGFDTGYDELTGHGLVNGVEALRAVLPPTITDVRLYGSGWTGLDAYEFSTLVANGEQFKPIFTEGADTLEIVFSEHVLMDGTELSLMGTDLSSVTSEVTGYTFNYHMGSHTATWTFTTPLADGKYAIHLDDSITDAGGNMLDAEWDNPDNNTPDHFADDILDDEYKSTFATGNGMEGTIGSEFRFHFALLAGDYDGDGIVEASESATGDGDGNGTAGEPADLAIGTVGDILPLRAVDDADFNDDEIVNGIDLARWEANYGKSTIVTHAMGDANGDGKVNTIDLRLWEEQYGNSPDPQFSADFDGDGDVDGDDFLTWQQNQGLGYGDANGDTWASGTDFLIWQTKSGLTSAWYVAPEIGFQASTIGSAPVVNDVVISGSVSTHTPFSFDSVDGDGGQLATVPVGGADTISIVFSENVNVSAESLEVMGLTTANVPTVAEFTYDASTYTATWRFEGWTIYGDNYLLSLKDAVTDVEGNLLDGEWTNPQSISTTNTLVSEFPSGDGIAGGNFNFAMTLLPGDVDLDGDVDSDDLGILLVNWDPAGLTNLFIDGDVDGDGAIDPSDSGQLFVNWQTNLQTVIILADLNGDSKVTNGDLNTITDNLGMTGATYADGDLDGDGDVDQDDLDLAFAQYGIEIDLVA